MIFRLIISPHAQARRKQMKITERRIEEAVADPDMTYTDARHGPRRRLFIKGQIVVVTDEDAERVVTVLWHGSESREEGPRG